MSMPRFPFDPDDPVGSVGKTAQQALGVLELAGYAIGLDDTDMRSIVRRGLPTWAVAVTCLSVGAIGFARWAPERWLAVIKDFGKRRDGQ